MVVIVYFLSARPPLHITRPFSCGGHMCAAVTFDKP
jgi:hypothetical protein